MYSSEPLHTITNPVQHDTMLDSHTDTPVAPWEKENNLENGVNHHAPTSAPSNTMKNGVNHHTPTSAPSNTLPPALSEQMFFNPKTEVRGDLSQRFGNPTPTGKLVSASHSHIIADREQLWLASSYAQHHCPCSCWAGMELISLAWLLCKFSSSLSSIITTLTPS